MQPLLSVREKIVDIPPLISWTYQGSVVSVHAGGRSGECSAQTITEMDETVCQVNFTINEHLQILH